MSDYNIVALRILLDAGKPTIYSRLGNPPEECDRAQEWVDEKRKWVKTVKGFRWRWHFRSWLNYFDYEIKESRKQWAARQRQSILQQGAPKP